MRRRCLNVYSAYDGLALEEGCEGKGSGPVQPRDV